MLRRMNIIDVSVFTYIRYIYIPYVQKETEADCLEKCKNVFKDLNVHIPDNCLDVDRAHRIGKISEVRGVKKHASLRCFVERKYILFLKIFFVNFLLRSSLQSYQGCLKTLATQIELLIWLPKTRTTRTP